MALDLENANSVKQKVKIALTNAHPVHQGVFKALMEYLATQGGNPDLQFVAFTEAQCDAAGGTNVVDAASQVYGIYVAKVSEATDNYFKLFNDLTDDTTTTDQVVAIPLLDTAQTVAEIYPGGLDLGTGIVVTQHTTSEGSSDGSDGGDGFLIIGAA